jgi:hypothetical protein
MGFILPNKFFRASYGKQLRGLLSEQQAVWQIVDFGDAQVFEDATTYTCLLFLRKAPNSRLTYVAATDWLKAQPGQPALLPDDLPETLVNGEQLSEKPWAFVVGDKGKVLSKLDEGSVPFGQICERMFQGLVTSADAVYILDARGLDEAAGLVTARSKEREQTYRLELGVAKPTLKGSLDMRRYRVEEGSRYVIFPYREGKLMPADEFAEQYPNCWTYLLENRERLEGRERGTMRHEGWYGYVYPKNLTLFERPKLLTPSIAQRASFSYDAEGQYYFVGSGGGGGGGYGITLKEGNLSPLYVLGLLNSRPLDFYLQSISSPFRHGWYAYNKQYIERLPIRRIDFEDPTDAARHDRVVALVEEMLRVQKEHAQAEAHKEDRRHDLARQIERLDAEIDALVCELYGLTEEEIEIVGGPAGRLGQS